MSPGYTLVTREYSLVAPEYILVSPEYTLARLEYTLVFLNQIVLPRKYTLAPNKSGTAAIGCKLLLQQEKNREEELQGQIRQTVTGAWLSGRMYFRSKPFTPQDFGTTFTAVLRPWVASSHGSHAGPSEEPAMPTRPTGPLLAAALRHS